MRARKIVLLIVSVLSIGILYGQKTEYLEFPAQISLVYPIGTSGNGSVNYSYNFSLNALIGSTGEVKGCEIGGILNMNKSNLTGFQVAGIGNITKGNVIGVQTGGIFSSSDSLIGVQISGILGKSSEVKGVQISGIFSSSDSLIGVQISGILGKSSEVKGVQISGIFSSSDSLRGVQISGILGKSSEVKGVQISGILNLSESANAMIGGIANINRDSLKGVQIAGIYNQTKVLNGIQIGLINLVDTVETGISIGLINIVKKGYYDEWTVSVSDYQSIGFSYKSGRKDFYNIYSVGANFFDELQWVGGFGFGHIGEMNTNYSFQPEIILHAYFPKDFKHIRDTYITHMKFGFVRNVSDKLGISLAPSIYWSLKSNRGIYSDYGYEQSPIPPVYEFGSVNSNSRIGVGFGLSLGLNIK